MAFEESLFGFHGSSRVKTLFAYSIRSGYSPGVWTEGDLTVDISSVTTSHALVTSNRSRWPPNASFALDRATSISGSGLSALKDPTFFNKRGLAIRARRLPSCDDRKV